MADLPTNFGQRLRVLREQRGFASAEAFARAVGVAKQTVYNWEERVLPPPQSGLKKIASALRLPESVLLGHAVEIEDAKGKAFVTVHGERTFVVQEDGLRKDPTRPMCQAALDFAMDAAEKLPGGMGVVFSELTLLLAKIEQLSAAQRGTATGELMERVRQLEAEAISADPSGKRSAS